MYGNRIIAWLASLALCLQHARPFSPLMARHLARHEHTSLMAVSRREWMEASVTSAVFGLSNNLAAVAEDAVDDLAMPTEEEEKATAAAAMEARLKRKAELQKASAKPLGFKENMEAEQKKQQQLKKTKEERRIALCEELGRGC